MEITIPTQDGNGSTCIKGKNSIVLIGANGAGKTRMSVYIEALNKGFTHRISAQKVLNMPDSIPTSDMESAEQTFLFGTSAANFGGFNNLQLYGARTVRWNNHPVTHMLNDFSALMEYLMTDYFQELAQKDNSCQQGDNDKIRLKEVKKIWESVIIHRKLILEAGKIMVSSAEGNAFSYNGSEMSDGEREVFYFIGEALCAPKNNLIIVDEPENHLHHSLLVRLWDAIENARPDCVFLYITHNMDFARTRTNAQIIWVKGVEIASDGNPTVYYQLLDSMGNPDDLSFEILGCREKVLLVEGTSDKSFDRKLYERLFPDCSVFPMEGCDTVKNTVKSYRSEKMQQIHYKDVRGIVDRDRRTKEEIDKLNKCGIAVLGVAEVESLFLLPDVIRIVANCLHIQDETTEGILAQAKKNTLEFLQKNKKQQALLFTKQCCMDKINEIINQKAENIAIYESNLMGIGASVQANDVYQAAIMELENIITSGNYLEALTVINHKGLLDASKVPNAFGWRAQNYIDYILRLLSGNDETAAELRKAFLPYVPVHWGE